MKFTASLIAAVAIPFAITAHAMSIEPAPLEYAAPTEKPAKAIIVVDIKWTQERIRKEVDTVAARYGVSADRMWQTIKCEATDPDTRMVSTTIQSLHVTKSGVREPSFGLSQIHRPSHPHVTYEQAIDPLFAIDFMGKNFAAGNAWMWSATTCSTAHKRKPRYQGAFSCITRKVSHKD